MEVVNHKIARNFHNSGITFGGQAPYSDLDKKLLSEIQDSIDIPCRNINRSTTFENSTLLFVNKCLARLDKVVELEKEVYMEEGFELPNYISKELLKEFLTIYKRVFGNKVEIQKGVLNYNLEILPTVEGGVFMQFINNPMVMYIELYNNGEMVYIIKKIDDWDSKITLGKSESLKELVMEVDKFLKEGFLWS